MRKKKILKNEEGFTLIEIIAVLVIMGILASVAVPKFFDLQTRAREKAVYTAVAELTVRVNQLFAKRLLEGETVSQIDYPEAEVGVDIGPDFKINNWDDFSGTLATGPEIIFKVTYPFGNPNATTYDRKIKKPFGD